MDWFLKWYYWYKNLGDEILLFWVIKYIFDNFDISKLFIQAQDKIWLSSWIDRNKKFLPNGYYRKIVIVEKDFDIKSRNCIKFFWWWEWLTWQRPFPYDWRNLVIKYPKDIFKWNFVLLGWIWKPDKLKMKFLYKFLLPKAKNIIVREKFSYQIAKKYNPNSILYHDFAYDVFKQFQWKPKSKDYVLVNINTYISNSQTFAEIKRFADNYENKYFMPFDMYNDVRLYEKLKSQISDLQYYDWTKKDLMQIFEFMWWAQSWIWARLHFLLILHWFGKSINPLFYQEKIKKFFENN